MWKVCGLPLHERRIYHTLTSISVFSFFQLLQLLECLSGYMHGDNVTIKFLPDFHSYTRLNGFLNCFPWFTIATSNELVLGCKPHWSAKEKKTTLYEKWLLGGILQNSFPKNFSKFTEKYLWDTLFLTLLKKFSRRQACNIFKERPPQWSFRASRS